MKKKTTTARARATATREARRAAAIGAKEPSKKQGALFKKKYKASKYQAVYTRTLRVSKAIRDVEGKAGVYFIRPANANKATYIGYSGSNLYRTIIRHFEVWNDSKQERIVYPKHGYKVKIILLPSKYAHRFEVYLINKLKPRDNKDQDFTTEELKQVNSLDANLDALLGKGKATTWLKDIQADKDKDFDFPF